MLHHVAILIYRSFKRFHSTFFINLIGLSTGLACTLLIYLWVRDELNMDKFLDNGERLFQVMQNTPGPNGIETIEGTPGILAKSLDDEMPEVEYSATVIPPSFNVSKGIISVPGKRMKAAGQYVTKEYLNLFSYKMLHGNRSHVLSDKNGVVVSSALALKLFDNVENAVGQTIEWSAQDISGVYFVSGVFEPAPENATIHFDILLNFELFEEKNPSDGWSNSGPRTFILLKERTSLEKFNNNIRNFIKSKDVNANATLFIQKFSDRYLYGSYENGVASGGRIEYVKLFSTIAIFIVFIACINFMNLFTAKASRRMKEAGIKKALGAGRKTLVLQYLSESFSMAFLSMAVAVLFVDLLLAPFNAITGKQMELNFNVEFIFIIITGILVTTLLAGTYPSIYLSGFDAASVLKGKLTTSISQVWARTGCVIFQFVVSIILIVSVWIVYKQMELVQSKKLGYERDHVIYFNVEKFSEAFLSQIKNIPGVVNAGGGNIEAGKQLGGTNGIDWEGKGPDDKTFFNKLWMSYDLIETLNMEMSEGRSFTRAFGSTDQVIFNEMAIKNMGLKNPIGKTVNVDGQKMEIVGIIKDFHFESLYEKIKPCALMLAPIEYVPRVSVKIQAGMETSALAGLEKIFGQYHSGLPFEFQFMDSDYQKLYASEKRVSVLSGYFASIAVLISCLGLFGLVAFTAERRLKEIGIRKVLGSTEFGIVTLLTADFTKIVLASIVIGLPISYFLATSWLSHFSYRIVPRPVYFIGSGVIALVIAWLTVATQAIKAARLNPVKSLRAD